MNIVIDKKQIKQKDFRAYFDEALDIFELDDIVIFTALTFLNKEYEKKMEKARAAHDKAKLYPVSSKEHQSFMGQWSRISWEAKDTKEKLFALLLHWKRPFYIGKHELENKSCEYALVYRFNVFGRCCHHTRALVDYHGYPFVNRYLKETYRFYRVGQFFDLSEVDYQGWLPTKNQVDRLIELCRSAVEDWERTNRTGLPKYYVFD